MRIPHIGVEPKRMTFGSSGCDLTTTEPIILAPMQRRTAWTGLNVAIPSGYEGQVRGRSSLTLRGILVPLGTIDSDYRGEIGVTMFNLSSETQTIERGSRIAQLVICPVVADVEFTDEPLDGTERGTAGFGSTGT